jgi:hypothetical protein
MARTAEIKIKAGHKPRKMYKNIWKRVKSKKAKVR